MAKEFYVTTEIFYVAIGFHRVVLRQSVLCRDPVGKGKETSCRDRRVLCRYRVWPGQEFSITTDFLLCCDRVDNGGEALSRDRIFYVATECCQMERFCVAT